MKKRYLSVIIIIVTLVLCFTSLAFINQIEGMQISTIHSYAKKIISALGLELGYGTDVSVTSGDYKTKQIIADLVDQYISQKQKEYGGSYVKKHILLTLLGKT